MFINLQKFGIRSFLPFLKRIQMVALLIFICSISLFAAGMLDTGFGTAGKVSFRFSASSSDFATAAAIQQDGKIILVGTSGIHGQSAAFRKFAIARLMTNGTLDATFGNGGLVLTDINPVKEDVARAVAIQPNGSIVVGGTSDNMFALARYLPNGTLDASFGGGTIFTDFPESTLEEIGQVMILPDGKILAVGTYTGNSPTFPAQIALAQYNSTGTPDLSFGSNGKRTIFFPRLTDYAGAAIQPDGLILITGSYVFPIVGCTPSKGNSCDGFQSFLLRYKPQLVPDRKFGRKTGKEFSKAGILLDEKFGYVAVNNDGSILVSTLRSPRRYTANGRLEAIFDPPGFQNRISPIVQRPDGKVALCGTKLSGGFNDFAVALYSAHGGLIGTDQLDFFGADDNCSAILAQTDNKLVVAGSAQTASQAAYSFAAVRYLDITP